MRTGRSPEAITIDRDLAASPSAVFTAWTTAQHVARWFGGSAVEVPADHLDFVAEPGRVWAATMVLPGGATMEWAGEFVEVVPAQRFVFTITDQPADPARARVSVDLSEIPGGTHLRFSQETPGFTPEQQEGLIAGWQSFMNELELIAQELSHADE